MFSVVIAAAVPLMVILAGVHYMRNSRKNAVETFKSITAISMIFLFAIILGAPVVAFAQGEDQQSQINGNAMIGVALSTGLAALGAGIAVGLTGSAAIGAISEDPSMLGRSLIFVGLAEGVAIYGLVISIMIFGRV